MDARAQKLIQILHSGKGWMTSAQLAAHLDCSVRTIKSTVSQVNQEHPGTILSSRSGFHIGDTSALASSGEKRLDAIPQTAAGRKSYILRKLLLEEKKYAFDQLAAELCISPITLTNELTPLRAELLDHGLSLKNRSNALYIEGSDSDKKKFISQLIFTETKGFFSSLKLINDYFPNIDLQLIQHQIDKSMLEHHFFLNDYAMSNFLLHIAITIERNLNNFYNESPESPANRAVILPPHIIQTIDEICSALEETFNISLTEIDRYTFGVILLSNGTDQNPQEQTGMIEPSVRNLVISIQNSVKDAFDIDLSDHDFLIRFGLHLKNMLIRYHGGVKLRNPHLETIKVNYPYIYDVAVFISDEICNMTGVQISEDEIAYVALHVGSLVEQVNNEKNKIRAVLLYPGYYADGVILMKKIIRTFQDNLLLENLISSVDALSAHPNCELLISTSAVGYVTSVPFLRISNYLNSRDIASLAQKIDQLNHQHLRNTMEKKLKALFRPELFFFAPNFAGRDDAIRIMSEVLHTRNYVEEPYTKKLFEREKISSSAIGNLAIPHPIDMDARTTAIAAAICPNGLDWDGVSVNLVFMLAVQKEDRPLFRDIFDVVTEIALDPQYCQALMRADTFESFIQIMLSNL